jgi:Membrane protein involved in the export of O-antigen and teichoic acid
MKTVQVLKNKVVIYLASRYITYFIQFITSFIIAAKLGPYYMGIWGFVLLLLNYFQQFHFGIANSFNVLYVLHRNNKNECDNYIGNSLMLLSYLSVFVIFFYVYYQLFGISYFDKYHVDKYIIWVSLIAIMQYFVLFFLNLFRVKNQLNRVTFCQSVVVLLNFVCIFFFRGEELIRWLVAGYVIGNLLCIIMAFTSGTLPKFSEITLSKQYQHTILKKGLYLFLYNSCFYFIIISIRTVISRNYSVEEFGLFTFSYTLANALMLVLDALMFIVFPKVIGKLSSDNSDEVYNTIDTLRMTYITSAHMLIYCAIPCFPLVIYFMPQYSGALMSLNLISLTILIHTNSCGYLELLISRNKEKIAAALSSIALVLNIMFALMAVNFFKIQFSYVILATLLTYFLFTVSAMYFGRKLIGENKIANFLSQYFPLRLFVPYMCSLGLAFMGIEEWMLLPLALFVLLNFSVFRRIIDTIKTLLIRPESVSL